MVNASPPHDSATPSNTPKHSKEPTVKTTTFTQKLKPGQHVTWYHNATRGNITGTVNSVTRRDRSLYYFIELTLDSGENVRIQKHKNTLFTIKG